MSETEEPWDLVIGQVVAPFGINGQVKVRPETDSPERFRLLDRVCLELPSGEQRLARIEAARVSSKGVTVHFRGCHDRGQAEALRGAWVKIRHSMALPLSEGSYYLHQIVGLRVFTVDGRDLGEVTEVIQFLRQRRLRNRGGDDPRRPHSGEGDRPRGGADGSRPAAGGDAGRGRAVKIDVITIFPSMFGPMLSESILKRAQEAGIVEIRGARSARLHR